MKNVRQDAALLRLSLVQVGHRRVPSPPNNTERLRAYRNATDPVIGNGFDWQRARAERYAREQCADHPNDFSHSYTELTGGF